MDTAQWPQEIVVKPMEEIIIPNGSNSGSCSKLGSSSLERKVIRPQKEQAVNCPRCNSINTKFCYYNNYSLTQPRYFCKTCRRYWTEGGSLRNIPVGGGSRKNKRSSSSSSSNPNTTSSVSSSKKLPDLIIPPSSHQNPKNIHDGQDLNLGFSASHHDFDTITELIQVPNFDSNNKENNNNLTSSSSNSTITTSCHLSPLELLTGISSTPIREFNSFMPMPITTDPTSVYSSSVGFPVLTEFKPSLSFSLDGGYGGLHGVQESNGGRFLFPFGDLKQVSTTTSTDVDQQNRDQHVDSTGYWTGILGGGGSSW